MTRAVAAVAAGLCLVAPRAAAQVIAVEAERVMTMGPEGTIEPAVIIVRDGIIESVVQGTVQSVSIPAGARVLSASVVTPGFIDARTTLGLAGVLSVDDDDNEVSGPNQAAVRAMDAFNLREPMLRYARSRGVTVIQSGPGDANSIGGQAGIFRSDAVTTIDAVIQTPSALVMTLTESAKTTYADQGRIPNTRMANVGIIRQALLDARRYHQQRATDDPPERDLKQEALALLLNREIPALVAASRVDEIATALRLADEFGFRMIIVGAADARFVADKLAAADVAVLYSPPGDDLYASATPHFALSVPSILATQGVRYALVSGDGLAAPRTDLLIHATNAVRQGLSREDGLRAITIDPAELLGIGDQFGSIEQSKSADLVLFTGDPFDAESQIIGVVVGGRVNDRGSS